MGLEDKLPSGIITTKASEVAGFLLKTSMWPATFGLACCAIEMMAAGTPDYDIARYGMERFSATPRQADLIHDQIEKGLTVANRKQRLRLVHAHGRPQATVQFDHDGFCESFARLNVVDRGVVQQRRIL